MSDQPSDPQQQAAWYLSMIRSTDSIMEPNIAKVFMQFLSCGGHPQDVVQALSESYKGYAQMCNLMCEWLQLTGVDSQSVENIVEDELKKLIMEVFDPKKADTIFSEGQSAPQWLNFMITEPNWRSLIYQLSEEHSNCLMLNFAIQRISDLGLQGEIASLTTASTYFGVFNRVLQDTLLQICTLDEMSLSSALSDLKKMCCHSQHTYLYAQAVIHSLMNTQNGHRLKRLSEELALAIADKGSVMRRINFLLSNINTHPVVAQSLTAMLSTSSTNPGDMAKLFTEYSKPEPPPVEFLRHPDVFELFIRDLFNTSKTINPTHKTRYIYVLAYAASVRDAEPNNNNNNNNNSNNSLQEENKLNLEATIDALETVQPICIRNSFGFELQQAVPILKSKLSIPVVAMGLLYWLRSNFLDPSYYTTSYNNLCTPIHLDILRDICSKHPLQRPMVFDILVKSFMMEPELEALAALDLKRSLLDNIIYTMRCGYVMPVMDTIENWVTKTDQSLIRYFVVQVLEMVEAPFSDLFVRSLLRIVYATVDALKSTESSKLIKDFISHCSANSYPWSEAEKVLLAKLSEVFV